MRFLILSLFLAFFSFSLPVLAAETSDPLAELVREAGVIPADAVATTTQYSVKNPPPMPKALKDVELSGGQMRYLGEFAGMYGWVSIRQGQPEYYYSTLDGKGVVMGIMFAGTTGDLITGAQLQAMKDGRPDEFQQLMGLTTDKEQPKADVNKPSEPVATATQSATPQPTETAPAAKAATKQTPSDMLLGMLANVPSFLVGDASAPKLYAFIDPECPHCKRFLKTISDQKYLADKKLAVQVIPVARNAQATQKAAYLLAVPNASDIILKSVDDPSVYDSIPKNLSTTSIERNLQLLLKLKLDMTPSFVYRATNGEVKIVKGLPDDIGPMLVDLGTIKG